MKLSIVIICWNDLKVVKDAIRSIYEETQSTEFEVIISDNGSTDGSVEYIREHFPHPNLRIVENGENLGFGRGNNAGIQVAHGEYVLILNPDTIILDRALDKLIQFADKHPEAGAFGCRVQNPDGSFQETARPFPTVRGYWVNALGLKWMAHFSNAFLSGAYVNWHGDSERVIDWHSGCCVLVRGPLLHRLGGFDPQFFYHCEEVDLCLRVWQAGFKILFTPDARITHLGGQSVKRAPTKFAIETFRNRYRYFYKHFGARGVHGFRRATLVNLGLRIALAGVRGLVSKSSSAAEAQETRKTVFRWNYLVDPIKFVNTGQEPDLGYGPLVPHVKVTSNVITL